MLRQTIHTLPARASAVEIESDTKASAYLGDFLPSDKYDGSRPGYSFKAGALGLGYYRDLVTGGVDASLAASAAGGLAAPRLMPVTEPKEAVSGPQKTIKYGIITAAQVRSLNERNGGPVPVYSPSSAANVRPDQINHLILSKMDNFLSAAELRAVIPGCSATSVTELASQDVDEVKGYLQVGGPLNDAGDWRGQRLRAILNLILMMAVNPQKTIQVPTTEFVPSTCCFCFPGSSSLRTVMVAQVVDDPEAKASLCAPYIQECNQHIRHALKLCFAESKADNRSKSGMAMSAATVLDGINQIKEGEMRALVAYAAQTDPDNMIAREAHNMMTHPTVYSYIHSDVKVCLASVEVISLLCVTNCHSL
mmetsp:Transcript_48986/g.122445  ORF Transcript_48986/g.122445 Transcript_48986/m.122445 type:complete len:365 (-) Transcript_48986:604-1698(-)